MQNYIERLISESGELNKNYISPKEELGQALCQTVITEYKTIKDEMADITNKVKALIEKGTEPEKIAVIFKENNYGEELIKYFKLKNIPFLPKRGINILELPFTKKIIQLLRYLAMEHEIPYSGDNLLFEILHFDFYKLPPIDIAKLVVEANNRKHRDGIASLRKLLYDRVNSPPRDLFDTGIHPGLKNFSKAIEALIADVSNVTLQQLFENMILNAGVQEYVMTNREKIELEQVITSLSDFIKRETSHNQFFDLQKLISIIDVEKEYLPLLMIESTASNNAVNILTAQGFKGLESEHVFVAGLNADVCKGKKKHWESHKFQDTALSSLHGTNDDEELRRLFYVALTQAEKHIYISYVKFGADGRQLEPSMFITEVLEAYDLPVERILSHEEPLMNFSILNFISLAPEIEKADEDFINRLLNNYRLNVTALNNFLRCPLDFYFKNVLKVPSRKSENIEFGSAIHFTIQRFFEKMQEHELRQFPSREQMITDFKEYLIHHRENFTQQAFYKRIQYGEKVIGNYYDRYSNSWNKIVAIERTIQNVSVRGVPIKGKIDKLEFAGKKVNIVDYKTGNAASRYTAYKLSPPNDQQPKGGDYWRQAVFYKILLDNYESRDWEVVSTEFDFVEPDKENEFRKIEIIIKPQDIETVTQQVIEVWRKIQNRDFYTGCGKEDCHWCNFVKDNKLAIAFHELHEEES
jgi:DNA helicase-2/ATP-dependent DNA helicase PcrA